MASKYSQKFPIPETFPEILHDFSREILRDQPEDIIAYAAEYFECLHLKKPFNYESKFNLKPETKQPSSYVPKSKQEYIPSEAGKPKTEDMNGMKRGRGSRDSHGSEISGSATISHKGEKVMANSYIDQIAENAINEVNQNDFDRSRNDFEEGEEDPDEEGGEEEPNDGDDEGEFEGDQEY